MNAEPVPPGLPAPSTGLPAPPAGPPRLARRLSVSGRLVAAGAALAAVVTRGPGLSRPRILVFDEIYYALQAQEIATGGVEVGHTVHPPLGKWLLAIGVRIFGFTPFGWRIVPLLAGGVVAAMTVVAAGRMTRRIGLVTLAAVLVLTDGIAFTTGRLALLDGLLAAFTTAALAVLLHGASRPLDAPLHRRVTWSAALLLGAAVAVKWSAVPLVGVAIVVVTALAFEVWPAGPDRRRAVARRAAVLTLVPLALYAASYVPTLVAFGDSGVRREVCSGAPAGCHDSLVGRITAVAIDQARVWRFHRDLRPTNRYAASGSTWLLQTHPTGLLVSTCDGRADPVCAPGDRGVVRRIMAVGNPVLWLAGGLAIVGTALLALRRRDPIDLVLALAGAAWWLPWILGRRPGYAFYGVTLVPVWSLALVRLLDRSPPRARHVASAVLIGLAVMGAVALYPVWTARPTAPDFLFSWFRDT